MPGAYYSKYFYVHRLSYMLKTHSLDIPEGLHVSHLCHFSLCVNPAHLSLEPPAVNVQRQRCGDQCGGHRFGGQQFPDCILR